MELRSCVDKWSKEALERMRGEEIPILLRGVVGGVVGVVSSSIDGMELLMIFRNAAIQNKLP